MYKINAWVNILVKINRRLDHFQMKNVLVIINWHFKQYGKKMSLKSDRSSESVAFKCKNSISSGVWTM